MAIHPVSAQLTELIPGARIQMRVTPGRDYVDGTIIARDSDSMVVATQLGAQHRVAISSLTSLELYRGRTRTAGAKKGAVWGLVVGAVPVAIAYLVATSRPESLRNAKVSGAMEWISFNVETGAVIGAFVRAESWRRCARLTAPTCDSRP